MDRTILENHLRLVEGHVALGERHLARQREIVAGFERNGHDTTIARQLLATFEETQLMHLADRDRLKKELGVR